MVASDLPAAVPPPFPAALFATSEARRLAIFSLVFEPAAKSKTNGVRLAKDYDAPVDCRYVPPVAELFALPVLLADRFVVGSCELEESLSLLELPESDPPELPESEPEELESDELPLLDSVVLVDFLRWGIVI